MTSMRHPARITALLALLVAACPAEDAAKTGGASPADSLAADSGHADPADTGGQKSDTGDGKGGDTGLAAPDAGVRAERHLPPGAVAVVRPDSWVSDIALEPRNVHMTWQRDPATTITVSWATTDSTMIGYTPRLWVAPRSAVQGDGPDASMPWHAAWIFEGTGVTYNESLGGVPLGGDYVSWTVEATGLDPETEYVYRVGTWESFDAGTFTRPDLSPAYTLHTGPLKGARQPIRFILAGDSRGGMEQIAAAAPKLAVRDAPLWFFNGDFTPTGIQAEFDAWWEAMAPIVSTRPLMAVQGNHEFFADLFYEQFALPDHGDLPEPYREHAWSFDYANVHFVGLDSNIEEAVIDQVPWLDADLAAAQKDPDIDWIIVMMHHPAYSACVNHGSTKRVQDYWVPLFEKHDVDIVFSGHDHNYERTWPLREGQKVAQDKGIQYIVAGAFFSPPYDSGTEWWTAASVSGTTPSFVEVEIDGLHAKATARAIDGGAAIDEVEITKPAP